MRLKRKSFIYSLLILVVLLGLAYSIGNYFVNYALVYNQGGQDRVEETDTYKIQEDRKVDKSLQDAETYIDKHISDIDDISIQAQDQHSLKGTMYRQNKSTHKWAILVHGYQADEASTHALIPQFYDKGYHILTVAMRGHGKSGGQYIGMGFLDKEDINSWANYIVDQDELSQIVLHGTSMGASTVLFASGIDLPEQVTAIIADAPYTSIIDIFESELKHRFNFPAFPILNLSDIVTQVRAGYSLYDGDVRKYVRKTEIPILILQSAKDDFVPPTMAEDLYEVIPGYKQLRIFPEGSHANARYHDPKGYYKAIFQFIE